MLKTLVVIALTLLPISSAASLSDAQVIAKATPAGFKLRDTKIGDVNLDGRPDKLVVLERSSQASEMEKRPLLIFTRGTDKMLRLVARNDNAVLCRGCGGVMGDPYQGITIKNGFFSIEHYGGSRERWSEVITFRFEGKDARFYLWKYGGESFDSLSANPDKPLESWLKTSKQFGKLRFEDFDPEKIR